MQEMGWDHNSFVGKCMALRKFLEFYRLQRFPVTHSFDRRDYYGI